MVGTPSYWHGFALIAGVFVFSSCEGRAPLPDPDPDDFGIPGDGDGDEGDTPGDEDGLPESGEEGLPDECFTVVDSLTITDSTHFESVNCIEHVLGDIQIGATRQLPDLSLLSNLRRVDGTLRIVANDALTSLEGLDKLEQVHALELYRNKNLSNLLGVESITELDRLVVSEHRYLTNLMGLPDDLSPSVLFIEKNALLPSLDGLPIFELPAAGEPLHVTVRYNRELNTLDGLSACCASQPISLVVKGNDKLDDLDGLQGFTALTSLELYDNFAMQSLKGISALTEVDTLLIEYDRCLPGVEPSLEDFSGAEALTRIDVLRLEWVTSLASLDGLQYLTQLSKLSLFNSPELALSEVDDFIEQTQAQPQVCGCQNCSKI